MLLSVRKYSLLAGIFLLFAASCGELADLSRELDYIELSFIHAAMQSEMSENRKNVQTRLQNFHNRLIRFDRKLKKERVPGIPNFLKPAGQLVLEFQTLSFVTNSPRLPRYKGTSLGHYSKVYNEYLRDVNTLEGKKKTQQPRCSDPEKYSDRQLPSLAGQTDSGIYPEFETLQQQRQPGNKKRRQKHIQSFYKNHKCSRKKYHQHCQSAALSGPNRPK